MKIVQILIIFSHFHYFFAFFSNLLHGAEGDLGHGGLGMQDGLVNTVGADESHHVVRVEVLEGVLVITVEGTGLDIRVPVPVGSSGRGCFEIQ